MKHTKKYLALAGMVFLLCGCGNVQAQDTGTLSLKDPKQFQSEDGVYELCGVHWGSDLEAIEQGLSIDLDEEPFVTAGDWLKAYEFMDTEERVDLFGYDASFYVELQNDGPQIESGLTQVTIQVTFPEGVEPVSGFEIYEELYPIFARELGEAEIHENSAINSKVASWTNESEHKSTLQLSAGEDYFVCALGLLDQRK